MLIKTKSLYGKPLSATDGEIGQVQDFYFDDQTWSIRFVVAATGPWLSGRQVLLSPHAFASLDSTESTLGVDLTCQQIENSPPIDLDKPVSRQAEEEYYRYYGRPTYWQGDGLWGTATFPLLTLPEGPSPDQSTSLMAHLTRLEDTHLRSTHALTGYQVDGRDRMVGQVWDFVLDSKTWLIQRLVIKTGLWFPGKELEISTGLVDQISFDDSVISVDMTGDTIEQSSLPQHVSQSAVN